MKHSRKKEQKSLVHGYLKQDAFPTLFSGERPPMASSSELHSVIMLVSDKFIVFYVVEFIAQSLQKKFKCTNNIG